MGPIARERFQQERALAIARFPSSDAPQGANKTRRRKHLVLCGGGWEDSMLLGFTFTATGWMFTAVDAVTARIGSDSRTANSMAVGTLGVLFLARGFLFSVEATEWTTWINPLGWMQETRPATGNHWWPLLLARVHSLGASPRFRAPGTT